MEPENLNEPAQKTQENVVQISQLHQVTHLSKYLAMALFIALPFIGGWIGYTYAPEKVVEVEETVFIEKEFKDTTEAVELDMWSDDDSFIEEIGLVPVSLQDYYSTSTKYENGIRGERYFWDWADETYTSKVLRVLTIIALDEGLTMRTFAGVDIDSFEDLGNDYARDMNNVYYFGVNPRVDMGLISGADPQTFELIGNTITNMYWDGFARDEDSLFYLSKNLVGIDPDNFEIGEKGIIYSGQTVWFPANDCHFGDFREGTFEELEAFDPPC